MNARDKDGFTPLHKAAEGGKTEVADLLIKAGAKLEVKDNVGRRPLHWAVKEDEIDVAEFVNKSWRRC